jgi:hypothetical protein
MLAAVCAGAACTPAKTIATAAKMNTLNRSKNTSSFTDEHGWIGMDAGEHP